MSQSDPKVRLTLRFETDKPILDIKKRALELGVTPTQLMYDCYKHVQNEGKVFPEVEKLKEEVKKYKVLYLSAAGKQRHV